MKLSLAWIFDHIGADQHTVDVHEIVKRFNKTTAEIESYYQVKVDHSSLSIGIVESISKETIAVFSQEWNKKCMLPFRADVAVQDAVILAQREGTTAWATMADVGGHKTTFLSPVSCDQAMLDGSWKKFIIENDWIIEVDNKSINHRPDLWSHRGIAREIAAIFDMQLKDLEEMLAKQVSYTLEKSTAKTGSVTITVDDPAACKRYSALHVPVRNKASIVAMALRLARIDSKPIDAVVDCTNYVMFDIGQPMHAFDAHTLTGNSLAVRFAKNKEKIVLLDGQEIELQSQALVIADQKMPVALAGVMGGNATKVSLHTQQIVLESATFDPVFVRKTALYAKIRTDASARFEKSLDPENTVNGIRRFLVLAREHGLVDAQQQYVPAVVGSPLRDTIISCNIEDIQKLLGIAIELSFIEKTLHKLDFTIEHSNGTLKVTVPSFRATKDVSIAQDITEEVGRFYGYESIPTVLPRRYMAPFGVSAVNRVRSIKHLLAYGLGMHEVYNYSLFDQEFINSLRYEVQNTAHVMSPVSENWRYLVTSLIPGLLKNVVDNSALHEKISLFEWGRVWNLTNGFIQEHKKLSGIFFDKNEKVDFYNAKSHIQTLFAALNMSITWKQLEYSQDPWFMPFQSAYLYHGDTLVGIAGKIQKQCLHIHTLGDAFIFELDGNFLLEYSASQPIFAVLPKYQPTSRDVSVLVDLRVTVDQLMTVIKHADTHITDVTLKDVFQKAEWSNKKSITLHYVISHPERTIAREESEKIGLKVAQSLKQLGAEVR